MSIKTNGTGSRLTIDLGTTHDVDVASEGFSMCFWAKHTINFDSSFEGFGAISAASNDRSDSIETHNNGVSGSTGQFNSSVNSSGIGLSTPNLPVNTWFAVMISRPAGSTTFTAAIYVKLSGSVTSHTNLTWTHTGPFRYVTLGDLAVFGAVTGATAEFAHLRIWRSALTGAELEDEVDSPTPVITSNLVLSLPMDSRSSNTDQGPNGFSLSETGTITDGASDPPPGPASSPSPEVDVEHGTLSIVGQNVTLDAPLSVEHATATLTGSTFFFGDGVLVEHGTLLVAGQDVVLQGNDPVTLPVTNASLAVEGQELPFILTVPWDEAALTLTGQEITFIAGVPVSLVVDFGALSLAGQDITVAVDEDFTLPVTAAAIALAGQDVILSALTSFTLNIEHGSLLLSTQDVSLVTPYSTPARKYKIRRVIRTVRGR